ncbi:MAG TPA: glycine--tRNA ligase subunit beta [Bryobacteraceae bacterium]|nr:glycine--tRNA ligase subunit beta [Bryobacteraceae bacterium]
MSIPFLLEIGTEEIPDWMIPGALDHLRAKFPGENVRVDATGRRLVVRADVAARTPDREEVVTGPPANVTGKALDGFCAKQGVTPDQLTVAETPKGKYWSFTRKIAGRPAAEILREEIPALVQSIPWPKTMYWPSLGGPKFIRPIRWIVALLGNEVVDFEFANVRSSNTTFGHRRLGARGPLPVTVDNYEQVLEENFVIVSAEKRRAKILAEVAAVAEAKGLRAKADAKLVEVLTYITEYPTAILGSFDAAYLSLPSEVLVTVMRHHQKYFSVENADGTLAPNFIAIMNIPSDPEGHVVNGNERVLRARFNDARFFYEVDQKKPLADRNEDLSHVTFQAKVGNYLEKTERVAALAAELGGSDAEAAARLCKADLTTEMVKEFTDLQGIVGGLYARAQGAPDAVAQAIYEHYKPLSMEDSIPSTQAGQALSVADKLDTLRSCFAVGLVPSGSKDPFALRRAAQGVVKILAEGEVAVSLDAFCESDDRLKTFFRERIDYYAREVRGFAYDEVNAVLAAGFSDVKDVVARLAAIQEVRPTENFEPLAAAFKRIQNILEKAGSIEPGDVDESKLLEIERVLLQYVRQLPDSGAYQGRLSSMAQLRPHVDSFFDQVLVNDPDPEIRENRLRLLQGLIAKFSSIADFSEIVTN